MTAQATAGENLPGNDHDDVRPEDFAGRHVVVGGAGISGVAAARALLHRGARVTVVDQRDGEALQRLAALGAAVSLAPRQLPADVSAVVVSPGWRPTNPLLAGALAAQVEVYSEPELAWRLRSSQARSAAPWLAITGTNGKTTAVTMLASMLGAAGLHTVACGNVGYPVLSAVLGEDETELDLDTGVGARPYEVLAVELSSFQLHWSSRLSPHVGAVLNLADDHLDWHGGAAAYAAAKWEIWRGSGIAIGNADDLQVAEAMAALPTSRKRVGFTLDEPVPGQLGVVGGAVGTGGVLVDRASPSDGARLAQAADVSPAGEHNVANALAAAALARAHGVPSAAIGQGLADYVPQPHRNQLIATHEGVRFVDGSKATNPHAAYASLRGYPRVVWVDGGQLKGVDIDELVRSITDRLVGAVLLGVDRAEIAAAISRHAPRLPVLDIDRSDVGAMAEAVAAAHKLASPGDVVLLAPAAASLDMFTSYGARGDAFTAAARAL